MAYAARSPEVMRVLDTLTLEAQQRLQDGDPLEVVLSWAIDQAFRRTFPLMVGHLGHARGWQ